jgi:hypothetical protein
MTVENVASERAQRGGLDWLVAQQASDGGWHSTTYGQLKDGAGVTTLVLEAIGHASAEVQQKHVAAAKRAYAFLDRGIAKRGTVASPDGSLDFPTYAAALWLTSRRRLNLSLPSAMTKTLEEYLLGAQVTEGRGFKPESPSYGGWDFLAKEDAEAITTGTNISVTRYVVEGLSSLSEEAREANAPRSPIGEALELARKYVLRCQQPDGGFAFTCEPASLNNKAAYEDEELKKPRPYATATCDGILALLACGAKPDDEKVAQAIAWLVKRPALALVPGFEGLPPEAGWQRGLRFYFYAGLARVLPLFPPAERDGRREALYKHVVALQQKNGSWVNESDRMRENDPLVATALAVMALGVA